MMDYDDIYNWSKDRLVEEILELQVKLETALQQLEQAMAALVEVANRFPEAHTHIEPAAKEIERLGR